MSLVSELRFLLQSGAAVDEHTADQLVIYNALACCRLKVRGASGASGASSRGRMFRIVVAPPSATSSEHLSTVVALLNADAQVGQHCEVRLVPYRPSSPSPVPQHIIDNNNYASQGGGGFTLRDGTIIGSGTGASDCRVVEFRII